MEEKIIRIFNNKLERLKNIESSGRHIELEQLNTLIEYWRDVVVQGVNQREDLLKDMLNQKEENLSILNDKMRSTINKIEQLEHENTNIRNSLNVQKLELENEKLVLGSSYREKYDEEIRRIEKEYLSKYIDYEKIKIEKEELSLKLQEKLDHIKFRDREFNNQMHNVEADLRRKESHLEEMEEQNKDLERTIDILSRSKISNYIAMEKEKDEQMQHVLDEAAQEILSGPENNQKLQELQDEISNKEKELEEIRKQLVKQKNDLEQKYSKLSKQEIENKVSECKADNRKHLFEMFAKREEAYSKSLERISRGFVHKMRNIFGIVGGAAQLCQSEIEPYKEDAKDLIKKIKEPDSEYISGILENLEAVSKHIGEAQDAADAFLEITKVPAISMQKASINAMLDEVCYSLDDKCKENDISVTREFAEGIPEFNMDQKLIKDAFYQIVLNSIESISSGGTVIVKSEYDIENKAAVVSIKDDGEGIPEQRLTKIFQIFCSSKKDRKGMGLPHAQRFIEAHMGSLKIESEKNNGTEVFVTLPVVEME
jgi:nitrogen-specific signal transduction histidine kinase